ncbi:sugar ABC transporter permease protein [Butyrivibrio proteoclasticus B316]|uniref:Sugar ABC transporter permease protein n=1 Tax=Butyrivibrio proteoclasticus (strain ATCC 51982 / DSM 14932 / B316) TaxID=515622 RepID=E0S3A5_BUTPB|nr:ABC transporter permease subunit [Butyrivibrio proteoclasticus]ADL35887.1 sugar ABC transporter permease protein [Butyrivibrio proteoclasticus B316]
MANNNKGTKISTKNIASEVFYQCMMLPGMVFVVLFNLVPMLGVIMAFQDYKPAKGFLGSKFVGLKHYIYLFQIPDGFNIFRNTLVIAIGKIVIGTLMAIVFSILLNEIRHVWLKKGIQTVVYLPHFLSWVILATAIKNLFRLDGFVNAILGTGINFLGSNSFFQPLLIGSDVWKEFGYNSVVYLAALTAIDPGLHEAAKIDGANWWDRVIHVTLPGMRSVIILMCAMSLGSILNAGFDQVYNLYTAPVYETGDIIDTYVYRVGLTSMQYSFATAIGLMKSVIAFVLMMLANHLAKKYTDSKIF